MLAQLQEWYLFPSLLDTTANKAAYADLQDYIDAVVAPARAQSRDRYFTYITSIQEEDAFYEQGTSAGFGFRLTYDIANRRVYIIETFENTPALDAGIDRGAELLAITPPGGAEQTIDSLMAQGGPQAVVNALGPNDVGVTRVLRYRNAAGVETQINLGKANYQLDPVSDRYGVKIINDNGKRVGYINLRTFIDTAEGELASAFENFGQQGVTELIIDLRYNGGGLISVAHTLGDLMGRNRQGDVLDYLTFRESKSEENETFPFNPRPQSIAPTKIAFIGTQATASASELVINAMQPYLGDNMALIGRNTYGKPVGQIAIDRPACDDRLRVVAFRNENANRRGDYYTGLASTLSRTCVADDDPSFQLGDPRENMVATALDFLAGRSCTPISASAARIASRERPVGRPTDGRRVLRPDRPGTVQREVPGAF